MVNEYNSGNVAVESITVCTETEPIIMAGLTRVRMTKTAVRLRKRSIVSSGDPANRRQSTAKSDSAFYFFQ